LLPFSQPKLKSTNKPLILNKTQFIIDKKQSKPKDGTRVLTKLQPQPMKTKRHKSDKTQFSKTHQHSIFMTKNTAYIHKLHALSLKRIVGGLAKVKRNAMTGR
jgi:hypothetical protein